MRIFIEEGKNATSRSYNKRHCHLLIQKPKHLTKAQLELLKEACKKDSLGQITHNMTVQTCWDADRLDLGRVGIRPNPKLLGTAVARNPDFISDAYFRSKQSFVNATFAEN